MSTYRSERKYEWIPPMDASDEDILRCVRRIINPEARFRRWHMQRMGQNLWAYRGRHWITPVGNLVPGGSGTYYFREVTRRSAIAFKRPVENLIGVGVDNLVSRIGRKEYIGNVRADRKEPELRAAARTAQNVLEWDLEKSLWADEREALIFDLVVTGTCSAHSYWDETTTDPSVIASPDAAWCPGCSRTLASRQVPLDALMRGRTDPMLGQVPFSHLETADEVPAPPGQRALSLNLCPACEQPSPLQPFSPSVDEVQQIIDTFARPLGLVLPRGQGRIELDHPWEVYPENGGVGVEPHKCRMWGLKKIRDMEWIRSHVSEEFAERVEPEDPRELMKNHPTMGDDAFSGTGYSHEGEDIYANHAAVLDLNVDPMPIPGLEKGRAIRVIGDLVVMNKALIVEVETPSGGKKGIPRIKHAAARYKRIPGEFWGRSPVDDALPVNRRMNEILAQMGDVREKGIPFLALRKGDQVYVRGDATGALNIVEFDSVDDQWNPKNAIVNSQPLTGNNYMAEYEACRQAIETIIGPGPVEQGLNAPGNKTMGQLQIQSEEVKQQRAGAERGLVVLYETLFKHRLETEWAFRKETEEWEVEDVKGDYERESYTGEDLLGQTNVKVTAKGAFEATVFQAAAVSDAIEKGILDVSNPVAKDMALDLMGIPKVNEQESIQIQRANQNWSEFARMGMVPTIDPDIHDSWIRFQVLGQRWESDEGVDFQRRGQWDGVLAGIAGWERRLAQAEEQDAMQRQVYEGFPPEQWMAIHAQGQQLAEAANAAASTMAQESAKAGLPSAPPPPPQNFPAPPQTGAFLPEQIEARLLTVWQGMLGIPPAPPMENPGPLETADPAGVQARMLSMYAVIQGYRIVGERKKVEAQAGAAVMSAPGGGRTMGGTEPVAGQPVIPAQGQSDLLGQGMVQ